MPDHLLYIPMSINSSRLPEPRPETGEMTVQEEVEYELIVKWHDNRLSLNLFLRDHEDFQHIVPDDAKECDLHDGPTTPSTLDDLPPRFQRHFGDTVRILKNKYNLTESDEPATCTACFPDGNDRILQFTKYLVN